MICRAVDAATEAGCESVVVVTGDDCRKIRRELIQTSAIIVENKNWHRGIGSSIRAGVQNLIDNVPNLAAIVLLVCDQPLVTGHIIEELITTREKTGKAIVASRYSDTLGVPVLFDHSCFQQLLAIGEGTGGKTIILSNHELVAELSFSAGEIDIDTAADWEKLEHKLFFGVFARPD